jgi:hypothetical protein
MKYVLFMTVGILLVIWVMSHFTKPSANFAQNSAEWQLLRQLDK